MDRTVTVITVQLLKNDQGHNTSIFIYIKIKLLLHTLSPIEYHDLLLPRYGNIPHNELFFSYMWILFINSQVQVQIRSRADEERCPHIVQLYDV